MRDEGDGVNYWGGLWLHHAFAAFGRSYLPVKQDSCTQRQFLFDKPQFTANSIRHVTKKYVSLLWSMFQRLGSLKYSVYHSWHRGFPTPGCFFFGSHSCSCICTLISHSQYRVSRELNQTPICTVAFAIWEVFHCSDFGLVPQWPVACLSHARIGAWWRAYRHCRNHFTLAKYSIVGHSFYWFCSCHVFFFFDISMISSLYIPQLSPRDCTSHQEFKVTW